jgi:saccharopine dehydrogenase (NAD+, L-lysine-forming)
VTAADRNGGSRDWDIVLYGATGFVGRLTAKYLASAAPGDARIALAGRNRAKLEELRDELAGAAPSAGGWGIVVASATDEESLDSMAAAAHVVVTTVGPYLTYGLPLVSACARNGTDYADLTGETLFVRDSIDTSHETALRTGARIVHACGFDSIPSDITTLLLHNRAVSDGAGALCDTTLLVRRIRGGASGGTAASGYAQIVRAKDSKHDAELVQDPYTLTTDRAAEPDHGPQRDDNVIRAGRINPALKGWAAPFFMGPFNTRIVRRSNALGGWRYGRSFKYSEAMAVGPTPVPSYALAGALRVAYAAAAALPASFIARILPEAGTGPSEQTRLKGGYTIETYTTTASGRRYVARMTQVGDPGYNGTAVLLGEAALCLAFDRDRLVNGGGVMTPAHAMGDPLSERLAAAPGVTLAVEPA